MSVSASGSGPVATLQTATGKEPSGKEHVVGNLTEFCEQQNAAHEKLQLDPKQLDRVAAGLQQTYKKWRCDSLDSSDSDSDS